MVNHKLAIEHESAHASAAILLGLDLIEVRVDQPDDCHGRVKIRGGRARPREFGLMVMSAFLVDARQSLSPFPPLPLEDETPDERQLREVAEELDLDRAGWNRLRGDALELVASAEFFRLSEAFKTALAHYPVLQGKLLEHVITIATAERGPRGDKEVALCNA